MMCCQRCSTAPDFARLRVLKVEDFEADADDSGPILLASVTVSTFVPYAVCTRQLTADGVW